MNTHVVGNIYTHVPWYFLSKEIFTTRTHYMQSNVKLIWDYQTACQFTRFAALIFYILSSSKKYFLDEVVCCSIGSKRGCEYGHLFFTCLKMLITRFLFKLHNVTTNQTISDYDTKYFIFKFSAYSVIIENAFRYFCHIVMWNWIVACDVFQFYIYFFSK